MTPTGGTGTKVGLSDPAVSYTHLDVYKRQNYVCGETGVNPVRARRREIWINDCSYQRPHFETEPLGFPEKAEQ